MLLLDLLFHRNPSSFKRRYNTMDKKSLIEEKMPVVQVSVWEGMSPENKKKTVDGITKVLKN
jgi:uncharacterized protein YaaW (UPF0174 family)